MTASIPALLQPLKDRLAAATPGPWEWIGPNLERCSPGYGDVLEVEVECGSYCYGGSPRMNISAGNKALLENAPTDQAKLIAAIEAVLAVSETPDIITRHPKGDKTFYVEAHRIRAALTQALGGDTA